MPKLCDILARFLAGLAIGLAALLVSCAHTGGLKNLGSACLPDGVCLVGIEASSTMEGPQVVGVQVYACTGQNASDPTSKASCVPAQAYHTGGPSLWQSVSTAFVGAAASSLGLGLPAVLLKPDTATIEQHGGGAQATSENATDARDLSTAHTEIVSSTHAVSTPQVYSNATAGANANAEAKAKARQTQHQRQRQEQENAGVPQRHRGH